MYINLYIYFFQLDTFHSDLQIKLTRLTFMLINCTFDKYVISLDDEFFDL